LSLSAIRRLYEKTEGKAWEPADVRHPQVKALVDGGWVKPCQMRCGFEAFDTGVKWTDAARIALATPKEDNPDDQ